MFKIPGFGKAAANHTPPDMTNVNTRPRHLKVSNCPNNSYALANVAAVSPNDFPNNIYIIIDNLFVFTTRHSNEIPPETVGFNGNQRTWGGWSLNQEVQAKAFDLFKYSSKQSYLGSIDIDISFRARGKAVNTVFDQDELAKQFVRCYESQIFSPTQYLIMEFQGHFFDLKIRNVQAIDLGDIEPTAAVATGIETKGILTKQTQINFFKGRDGLVNLKSSNSLRPRSNAVIRPDFKFEDLGVGGLDKEFTKIFRRAFASRIFPPSVIEKLGISHVKGLLLYGPPGTGKTLIARKIGTMLNG
ncbi:SEC18-like protein [Saccharomyces kudriavzevii IFO 1802]|uniref:Vesicular-fusion protein SEC18 n=1 Tax=Saccharomyces kudriavzevii (strain ATCC MYA-4449 / AS 2.2408 / CBS 8840 / NBRC 1802 / NCYC 2889) TaxID=226230 RepID=J6ECL8_SACK1|nr:SEC18-like protein [Saccharomyces kudriavzevii IFO 1802]